MDQEKQELIAKLDAGEVKEDVFDNMANEMDKTFEENCRSILNDEEYKLIFDREAGIQTQSSKNIESSAAEPEITSTSLQKAPEPENSRVNKWRWIRECAGFAT